MLKQINRMLITSLVLLCTWQINQSINLVRANCTTWTIFLRTKEIYCDENETQCCGWIMKSTCCTDFDLTKSQEIREILCKAVVGVIVIGIILIFIAFLIGWIYSCYLIAKQIQVPPENEERTTDTNGHSLIYSFFTRYIDALSTHHNITPPNQSIEVFSIPVNDKPPSYNSLFKPNTNIKIQQNGLLSQTNLPSNRPSSQSKHQQSNTSSSLSSVRVSDELPSYSNVIKNIP